MKKVTLVFPSVPSIWEFIQIAKPSFLQVRINERLVICNCAADHIDLAVNQYGAKMIAHTENN